MYKAVTRAIEVSVEPSFMPERSSFEQHYFFWAYKIVIANHSDQRVKLLNRYWNITDENGQVDEVSGPGVVGEQPVLNPGDTYEYNSGCPLDTPSGVMFGHYQMLADSGETFDVAIPAFSLDTPGLQRTLN